MTASPPHKVLVVEDDREIRETMLEIFEEAGFSAVAAGHGQAALEYLDRTNQVPCIILLDLMMPVMDGVTFRERQRQDPRFADVPVILMSAFRDVDEHAREIEPVAVLKKPVHLDELIGILDAHCNRCGKP
jgi:two-component system, OmpR family, response regulator CpxR